MIDYLYKTEKQNCLLPTINFICSFPQCSSVILNALEIPDFFWSRIASSGLSKKVLFVQHNSFVFWQMPIFMNMHKCFIIQDLKLPGFIYEQHPFYAQGCGVSYPLQQRISNSLCVQSEVFSRPNRLRMFIKICFLFWPDSSALPFTYSQFKLACAKHLRMQIKSRWLLSRSLKIDAQEISF